MYKKDVDNIWKCIKKTKSLIYLTNYLTTVLKLKASACISEVTVSLESKLPQEKEVLKNLWLINMDESKMFA